MKLKRIDDFIRGQSPKGRLGEIYQKLEMLKKIDEVLQNFLPNVYHDKIRPLNIRNYVLVLKVENAAFATKARFLQEEILSHLRRNGWPQLASLEWKILV